MNQKMVVPQKQGKNKNSKCQIKLNSFNKFQQSHNEKKTNQIPFGGSSHLLAAAVNLVI